jgi:hypothetical protein
MEESASEGRPGLLVGIEPRVRADSLSTAEARVLREAAAEQRFGPANWAAIARRLADAGLMAAPSTQPHESDPVRLQPPSGDAWTRAGRVLLEALQRVDDEVPQGAIWDADVVRDTTIGRSVGALRRTG